jgi:predicted DNA-binding protein
MKIYRTVKLEVELIEELDKLKHPGQTLNGVVRELIEAKAKEEGK